MAGKGPSDQAAGGHCRDRIGTLVVVGGDTDDDLPVERHYGVSEDGRRLVEVVGVKGDMDGFTMSRVWDRRP